MKKLRCICCICLSVFILNTEASEPSQALSLPVLNDSLGLSVSNIQDVDSKNKICLVGGEMKESNMKSYGRIYIVDISKNKIVWDKSVPGPRGADQLNFFSCKHKGNYIYVAGNVNTSNLDSVNQQFSYLYKFDLSGKIVAEKSLQIKSIESSFGYAFEPKDDSFILFGSGNNRENNIENNLIYMMYVDGDLNIKKTVFGNTGGFETKTSIMTDGLKFYIGGNFRKKNLRSDESAYPAAAMVNLAGKYVWSVGFKDIDSEITFPYFSKNRETTLVSVYDKKTNIWKVGPDGKVITAKKYVSAYCGMLALGGSGQDLYAVRGICAGKGNVLLKLNIDDGKENVVNIGKISPVYVGGFLNKLGVVAESNNGKFMFFIYAKDSL